MPGVYISVFRTEYVAVRTLLHRHLFQSPRHAQPPSSDQYVGHQSLKAPFSPFWAPLPSSLENPTLTQRRCVGPRAADHGGTCDGGRINSQLTFVPSLCAIDVARWQPHVKTPYMLHASYQARFTALPFAAHQLAFLHLQHFTLERSCYNISLGMDIAVSCWVRIRLTQMNDGFTDYQVSRLLLCSA